ncbi:MAG: CoA ester lyase [Alphaproteobacteria bacterium]|nr:CoA ester lyase [Alphaproteobacteria bacterium]
MTNGGWRSLFFAPANRHDLIGKFHRFEADNYVIDLEDGTPEDQKDWAREHLREATSSARQKPLSGRLLVRINTGSMAAAERDLAAALACDVDGIVVPKIEKAEDIRFIEAMIDQSLGDRPFCIVGGVESLRGVLAFQIIASVASRMESVYFGAEDLIAELGGQRSRSGLEVIHARQHVVLVAKSAPMAAIDMAVTEIHDDELFVEDSGRGRSFGYDGKICLNPAQVKLANRLFSPGAAEIGHARRLLAAFEAGVAAGRGTISFEGQMIDEPLVKRARAIIASVPEGAAS